MAQTRDGGKPNVKSLPYSPPKGPSGQMRNGVGLGGSVAPCGTQGHYSTPSDGSSGRPGIGGSNHGNKGTQR